MPRGAGRRNPAGVGAFSAPRAALIGALSLAALVTGTLAVAGLHTVAGLGVMTLAYTARMWSIADTNYSVLGRAVTAAIRRW